MSIVTRIEFAGLCQTTPAIINTNVSRKKISTVVGNKGMIDTENPLNKIFKKNQLALEKVKKAESKKETFKKAGSFKEAITNAAGELGLDAEFVETVFEGETFTKEETAAQKKARLKQNENDKEIVDWETRKKIADALKAERAAELAQLQVDKLMGSLMPVDLVEMILKVNIQDIFKSFENELINLGSIYCDILAGGDRDKLSELIAKVRLKLNEIIEKTKRNSAQEIENVIEDYSDSRSRGERK